VETSTIRTGFFTMDTVHSVMAKKDLNEAKEMVYNIIKSAEARQENVRKASVMVDKANSINNLAMAITNFMLAHPSENLKTFR
jgi:hypothetical protein